MGFDCVKISEPQKQKGVAGKDARPNNLLRDGGDVYMSKIDPPALSRSSGNNMDRCRDTTTTRWLMWGAGHRRANLAWHKNVRHAQKGETAPHLPLSPI